MSLKAFHVVFIFFSTIFLAAFAGWGILDFTHSGEVGSLAMGAGSGVGFVVMLFYSRWFLRTWKRVSYL
jgi:hypothetical protein